MRTNPSRNLIMLFAASVLLGAPGRSENAPRDPAKVEQQFNETMSHLDKGGDLLFLADMDGVFENLGGQVVAMTQAMAPAGVDAAAVAGGFARLHDFLRAEGFYGLQSIGVSVVPRGDGLNTMKAFLGRDAAVGQLAFWRGLYGLQPRRLAGVDYIADDAVFARVTSAEPGTLWFLFHRGVGQVAVPGEAAGLEKSLAAAAMGMGITFDALFESLGDEVIVSLALSRDRRIPLPAPGEKVEIAEPSLLLGVAVRDHTLADLVRGQMIKAGMTPITTNYLGATLESFAVPPLLPVPLSPTFTEHGGFFLIGSSGDAVKRALSAATEKNGLVATPEFQQLARGLSMTNNGISYVSKRLWAELIKIQSATMQARTGGNASGAPEAVGLLQKLSGATPTNDAVFVLQNVESGVMVCGHTPQSGRELVAGVIVSPLGMLAAVVIPNFVKARETSQRTYCINNLRMIEAAKEQWAMVNNKAQGDAVDVEGISAYLKGGKLPVCVIGGSYTLNPVGTKCTCNMPGHTLR